MASVGRILRSEDLPNMIGGGGPLSVDSHHSVSAAPSPRPPACRARPCAARSPPWWLTAISSRTAEGVRTFPPLIDQRGNYEFVLLAAREIKRMAAAIEAMSQLSEKAAARGQD